MLLSLMKAQGMKSRSRRRPSCNELVDDGWLSPSAEEARVCSLTACLTLTLSLWSMGLKSFESTHMPCLTLRHDQCPEKVLKSMILLLEALDSMVHTHEVEGWYCWAHWHWTAVIWWLLVTVRALGIWPEHATIWIPLINKSNAAKPWMIIALKDAMSASIDHKELPNSLDCNRFLLFGGGQEQQRLHTLRW